MTNGFDIAFQQNRTEVEANVEAVCPGLNFQSKTQLVCNSSSEFSVSVATLTVFVSISYLICRFLFITAHTREFPMMHEMTSMNCAVVMMISADLDMVERRQFQAHNL